MTDEMTEPKITIEGTEYLVSELPEETQSLIRMLEMVNQDVARARYEHDKAAAASRQISGEIVAAVVESDETEAA